MQSELPGHLPLYSKLYRYVHIREIAQHLCTVNVGCSVRLFFFVKGMILVCVWEGGEGGGGNVCVCFAYFFSCLGVGHYKVLDKPVVVMYTRDALLAVLCCR